MKEDKPNQKNSRAKESRSAIEKLYVEMRHVFNSGAYNLFGVSGKVMADALLTLSPEIYGSLNEAEKVELDGLVYVIDRLPKGIEECRFIKLTAEEGLSNSSFEIIIPPKRRRKCYRIDEEQMLIEITLGRSEIYDIITHLTFLYNEAEKIRKRAIDNQGNKTWEWIKLEEIVTLKANEELIEDNAFVYLSQILGRTFAETKQVYDRFRENEKDNNGLFHLIYWLGKIALEEHNLDSYREITFSPMLRERIGHHIHGEKWASRIKEFLYENDFFKRPLHLVSANLHSVMNSLFAVSALKNHFEEDKNLLDIVSELNKSENSHLMEMVGHCAQENGMYILQDYSGTNIQVQVFDTSKIDLSSLPSNITYNQEYIIQEKPIILVMDYAFGEQAYETMDELLKPFIVNDLSHPLNMSSISIMGKAGILEGTKGDMMIPTAHIFEGTADNYPFKNDFTKHDFLKDLHQESLNVYEGTMITVLGTSLQNKDVLEYFKNSSWNAIGLEMEGAHYQKAIQAASMIRKSISPDVTLRYAYYASDNPLVTGSTLASGSLGNIGVKPTYAITLQILNKILNTKNVV